MGGVPPRAGSGWAPWYPSGWWYGSVLLPTVVVVVRVCTVTHCSGGDCPCTHCSGGDCPCTHCSGGHCSPHCNGGCGHCPGLWSGLVVTVRVYGPGGYTTGLSSLRLPRSVDWLSLRLWLRS